MDLGVDAATMVVGNMYSNLHFDRTCLGNGIDLVAHLKGEFKPYAIKLLLSLHSAELAGYVYQTIELDRCMDTEKNALWQNNLHFPMYILSII
jgi:hypothetical protein